eukprot:scaffold160_cov188-Alexandrium_tamarense.AAC.14
MLPMKSTVREKVESPPTIIKRPWYRVSAAPRKGAGAPFGKSQVTSSSGDALLPVVTPSPCLLFEDLCCSTLAAATAVATSLEFAHPCV